jgi:Ca2+-transporting ATPase
MTCNSAEIWTIFLAPLIDCLSRFYRYIFFGSIITDGLPGLALAAERKEKM